MRYFCSFFALFLLFILFDAAGGNTLRLIIFGFGVFACTQGISMCSFLSCLVPPCPFSISYQIV